MILGVKPVTLWAERIKRCTVHGARTSKGPINQLTSSLRSRRKLRLGGPGNGQKSVRVRSLGRLAGRNGRVSRFHFPKTGRSRGLDTRLSSPAPALTIPEGGVIARLKSTSGPARNHVPHERVPGANRRGAVTMNKSPPILWRDPVAPPRIRAAVSCATPPMRRRCDCSLSVARTGRA
jgi:hypothetical protein